MVAADGVKFFMLFLCPRLLPPLLSIVSLAAVTYYFAVAATAVVAAVVSCLLLSTGGRITPPRWYRSRSPTPPSVAVAAVVAAAVAAESAAAGGGVPGPPRVRGGGVDGDDMQVGGCFNPFSTINKTLSFGNELTGFLLSTAPPRAACCAHQIKAASFGVLLGLNDSVSSFCESWYTLSAAVKNNAMHDTPKETIKCAISAARTKELGAPRV